MRDSFVQSGFLTRIVLAGTAAAAAALVRSGADGLIVPPGASMAAISPLPLATLRLPEAVVSSLSRLGLHSIADALRQPRGPLARRYGRVLLDALDAVTGSRPQPLQPVREPAAFVVVRDCLEPILTRPAIEHVLEALLVTLCRQLLDSGQGARRLTLRAWRVDGAVQELVIGTGAAAREVTHLRRLFVEPLGTLQPDLGFERFVLEASITEPLAGVQAAIAGDLRRGAVGAEDGALAELVDRLQQRLTVFRLHPVDSHWPEYAVAPADPFAPMALPIAPGSEHRPIRLFAPPLPIAVTAGLPNGPPAQLRWKSILHRISSWSGPERLEPEWWGEDAERPVRDYYRVECSDGTRLWICRLVEPVPVGPPRWFLHGVFA